MRDLNGKVAWVTGAGTGIGEAAALAFAGAGMTVVLSGRRPEPLEDVAGRIRAAGGTAETAPLDIGDAAAVEAAVAGIEKRHGRLDVLVNNAGMNLGRRRVAELDKAGWDELMRIDLNGPFYCTSAALPLMRRHKDGLVVTVSSWAGRYPSYVAGAAYSAAKAALIAFNHTLNNEEFVHGIRGCVICPAEVATPILRQRPVPPSDEDLARMLQPEDLGETILFVARLPERACINEIVISPTWNRAWLRPAGHAPEAPDG